jgi:hypothetical protein
MSMVVFGALPNKIPVPVTSSDAFRPFRLTLEGLRRFDAPRTNDAGVLTLDMDFITSSEICSQAYTQPAFTEDWAARQPLDFSRLQVQHIELSVNGADSVGNSTLADEIRQRHDDIVDELISAGANVNTANASGVTPLMGAIGANLESTRVLQRLLDAGADIDEQDKGGQTALMYAAKYRRKEAVKLLLARGANPTIRDNQGRTAAAHLSNYADTELTSLLDRAAAGHK